MNLSIEHITCNNFLISQVKLAEAFTSQTVSPRYTVLGKNLAVFGTLGFLLLTFPSFKYPLHKSNFETYLNLGLLIVQKHRLPMA